MDRTEASIAPARGGDRTDPGHRWRWAAVGPMLAVAGMGIGITWCASAAGAAGTSHAPTGPGPSGASFTLLAPPTFAGPSQPFAVRLGVSGGVARAELTLGVTVYAALSSPSEFAETLDGSPVGAEVTSSRPIALSSLAPDAADPQDGVDLSVPVTAGGVVGAGTGPFTAELNCQLGSCGGVYPVQIELTDATTRTVAARLLTYLVYTDPPADIDPLRFALVVPLALPSSSVASAGAAAAVNPESLGPLAAVMSAISGPRATVPLTLAPSPATVAALSGDDRARSKAALASLVSLTAGPDRQTLCGPFVPVNASALVTVGAELTEQVRRGAQVLSSTPGLHTGSCATDNVWVANATLDSATLGALATLGYNDVVVPPSAVSGPVVATTPTRRFTLDGARRVGNAILSDPELSARLQPTSRTYPALAADQLLAELELDYYEAPNTPQPRGVVAVPTASGHVDPAVVTDVLDGLQDNPMVQPVTLATLFSQIPVGGEVGRVAQPASRRPASVGPSTALPARAIHTARLQWTGFAAAVSSSSTGSDVAAGLDERLLEAESQQLTASQQRTGLARFENALGHQLALLSITSRDVRLTASTGSVPITVIKTAAYPVEAVLTVTSDKIAFSAGSTQAPNTECGRPVVTNSTGKSSVSSQCTFLHDTNAVYVEMRSRVSGDFRISVTLYSPSGGLELATGQLTVRSMSTSAVAIALSVAAGVVLLGWWGRTMWRDRRTRGAHRRRGGSGP